MMIQNDSPQTPTAAANSVWLVILALAGIGGSLVISCVTPFVALAIALAGTARLTVALRAMAAIWLANQLIGFSFLHFPRTPNSILWGIASGVAALLSTWVAAAVIKRAPSWSMPARFALALLLGFAVYEATHLVAGLSLGGLETFSLRIIAQLGLVNLAWLAGLVLLNELVSIVCKPWLGVTPRLARAS